MGVRVEAFQRREWPRRRTNRKEREIEIEDNNTWPEGFETIEGDEIVMIMDDGPYGH